MYDAFIAKNSKFHLIKVQLLVEANYVNPVN